MCVPRLLGVLFFFLVFSRLGLSLWNGQSHSWKPFLFVCETCCCVGLQFPSRSASLASQREELRHKEERMAAEIQDKLEELRSTLGEKHRTEINSIEERGRQDKIAWESLMQERLESQAARKEVLHSVSFVFPRTLEKCVESRRFLRGACRLLSTSSCVFTTMCRRKSGKRWKRNVIKSWRGSSVSLKVILTHMMWCRIGPRTPFLCLLIPSPL